MSEKENFLKNFNLQFFAEGGEGADGAQEGAEGGEGAQGTDGASTAEGKEQNKTDQSNEERIAKLVQSQVDRAMAAERKKNADLQKKLDRVTKEKMTDEELKKAEMDDKVKELANKEKELADRENRLFAIKAIKEAGLDDGSDNSLELVDFVMCAEEEDTTNRVSAFKSLLDKMVAAQVDKTFKANGRTPNGAGSASEEKKDNSIAERLGKIRAEQAEKSNNVLKHYLGGNK